MRDNVHGAEFRAALDDEVARRRLIKSMRSTDDGDLIASYIGGIRRELTVFRNGTGEVIDWEGFQPFLPLAAECLDALSVNPNLSVNDVYNILQVSHFLEQSRQRRFNATLPVFTDTTTARFTTALHSEGVPMGLLLAVADGGVSIDKSLLVPRELLRSDPVVGQTATELVIAELRVRSERLVGTDLSELPLEWIIQLADGWN